MNPQQLIQQDWLLGRKTACDRNKNIQIESSNW